MLVYNDVYRFDLVKENLGWRLLCHTKNATVCHFWQWEFPGQESIDDAIKLYIRTEFGVESE